MHSRAKWPETGKGCFRPGVRALARAVSDGSWCEFRSALECKATGAGGTSSRGRPLLSLLQAHSCVLVLMGVRLNGSEELNAPAEGLGESAESWAERPTEVRPAQRGEVDAADLHRG